MQDKNLHVQSLQSKGFTVRAQQQDEGQTITLSEPIFEIILN